MLEIALGTGMVSASVSQKWIKRLSLANMIVLSSSRTCCIRPLYLVGVEIFPVKRADSDSEGATMYRPQPPDATLCALEDTRTYSLFKLAAFWVVEWQRQFDGNINMAGRSLMTWGAGLPCGRAKGSDPPFPLKA